jgi:predicted nucleotidyltransferase
MKAMELTKQEQNILNEAGIAGLVLFGSRAQGVARETSDYDLFALGPRHKNSYDIIYDMFSKKITVKTDIDIVFEQEAPMELKMHVAKYGKAIFENHPSVFADFKEIVMTTYSDFAAFRRIFSDATLARI